MSTNTTAMAGHEADYPRTPSSFAHGKYFNATLTNIVNESSDAEALVEKMNE